MSVTAQFRRRLSIGLVVAMVAAFLVFATQARGNVVPEPDLHDGAIWVTNNARGLVGRTNAEIATVDTKLAAGSEDFDVLQSDNIVVLRTADPSGLTGIDPAQATLVPGPELPDDAEVGLGGETAALLTPRSGELRIVRATTSTGVLALDPSSESGVVATVEGLATMVVGPDGLVHVYERDRGVVTTWDVDGDRTATTDVGAGSSAAQLTVVGDRPVVLDDGALRLPGGEQVALDPDGTITVQEPGPAADGILLADDGRLLHVGFDGDIDVLYDGGTGGAARPVRAGGCSFAAWGAAPSYAQVCAGGDVVAEPVPAMAAGVEVRFRTNHDRVTLNALTDGSQLLFGDDDPVFIDNEWAEALSDEIEVDPEAVEELDEQTEPTCETPENGAPTANPDEGVFGTRRDRPVVVHPLRNDTDPDCDVLLIESVELDDPDAGVLGIIDGGRAVQVDMATEVDRLAFTYTISDGRGGRDSAVVSVVVVPESENDEPVLSDEETFVVTGGTVTHNVLATAYDPDGDVLRLLRAAEVDPASGTVRTNPRGDVTFTAGNRPGDVEVSFVVGDGRGGEQTGVLTVRVVERRQNQAPDARNDSVQTFVGRDVVFDVLDNDTDPNGDKLSIVRATTAENAQVRWDPTSPEIRVTADRAGTVNVVYRVTDGQATDEAVLRVDFRERGEKRPPVAVRDEVLLAPGLPAYVPVLDNDVDPDGEVLVVLGVSDLPDPSPITVTVLQRSVVKIVSDTALDAPVEFSYRISDGTEVADGRILVEPAPTTQENRPPVVSADEYTVRAGGIVTFPVLTNDSDPDGDALEIEPPPVDQPDAATDGRLFLSQDGLLRYEAPDQPRGTVRQIYSVRDTAENVASGEIIVHVLPPNADRNQPPLPPELVGRTVAGQTVTIPIPVTTMDPDGDSVTLLGIGAPPRFGTVVDVGADEIVYAADDDAAGTDEFTYRVVDQFGAEATATILVGVASRPTENNAPIPSDDLAVVRPGATVSIPVLANDFDPDADPLRISTDDEDLPRPSIGTAEVDGSAIRYTAPEEPGTKETSFRYTADDGRGGRRSATVTLTFREDGDNRPPVAADDATDPQSAGTELRLRLLDNDEDPDQDPLEIVEVTQDGATISPDGQAVEFVMPDEPVQFTYVVSDGIDTARAAVSVPLIDPDADLPPIARLDEGLEVDTGASITVDVLANDEDPEGRSLHLFRVVGARHGTAELDGDAITFTASEQDYVGDAGFSYVVGDSPDPAVAKTAVGSVRIRITGDVNTPPTVTGLTVDVPQGSERSIDLAGAVVDPDVDDEHSFDGVEVTGDGIDADLDGATLRVRADLAAEPGATSTVAFVVSDGDDEAEGAVRVQVTGSDRPLATLGADAAETLQGVPVTVDVLANDVNPFPDEPLEITAISNPSGSAGLVEADGAAITFTPDADFFGETTFSYTVADATGDPSREASGTVRVSVIGRPGAPPAPTCIGGESRSVRVQWVAPSANGAPITSYVLRVTGTGDGTGDRTVPNASTQDVDGLTNGVEYQFSVGAVNEAVSGTDSEPAFSPPSPPCTPDEVPGQPDPPVTTFGDQELMVTWTLPDNGGSPIEKLILTDTTNGVSKEFGPTVTEHTWEGLENGTNVRFTLAAENALDVGPVSEPSTGDGTPAGVPDQPAVPDASPTVGARDGFLDVRWTWSSTRNNGDAAKRFRVTSFRNGVQDSQVVVSDPQRRSQTFQTDNGENYRFTIEAENKAGWSQPSPQSPAAVSAGRPLNAPSVTASEGDTQSTLTLSGSVDDNGAAISRYEYSQNGGGWQRLPDNRRITGLRNGTDYQFRVRAVNSEGNGPASSPSNVVNPYGNPTAPPGLSGQRVQNLRTIEWTWNASDGNGRSIAQYEVSVDGGSWRQPSEGARRHRVTFPTFDTAHTIRVRAVSTAADANRRRSAISSDTRRTDPEPEPIFYLSDIKDDPCDSNPSSTCDGWIISGADNYPGGTHDVICHYRYRSTGQPFGTFDTNNDVTDGPNGAQPEFSGSMCEAGFNTELRMQVRGVSTTGGDIYTDWVGKR